MTSEQFAYWLQGFVELNPTMKAPSPEQWKGIAEHLQTVFVKVTPHIAIKEDQPRSSELRMEDFLRKKNIQTGRPFDLSPPYLVTC